MLIRKINEFADKIIDAIDNDSKVGLNAVNVVHKELGFQI